MILDEILTEKRREVARRSLSVSPADLQADVEASLSVPGADGENDGRPLERALSKANGVGLIAEVKRASPSAGRLSDIPDPATWAETYERAGADAISVLTDAKFFRGSLEDLRRVRRRVSVPVLRKDFIIDPYQVWESAAAGASAILLIVAALGNDELLTLHSLARALRMECLVEVHTREELQRALELDGVRMVGINNRDLRTFETRLETTCELAPLIESDRVLLVSESGIHSPEDVETVRRAGARAVLVGEALVRSGDPSQKISELCAAG